MPPSSRAHDERGLVLPTRVLAFCVSALAVAGLVFIANDADRAPEDKGAAVGNKPAASATPSVTPSPTAAAKPKPVIKRGEVFVEIFNNSRIKGLAGRTADQAKAAGWNVVGTDNWYGTIEASTVYFPPRLRPAGQALARDLGIKKTKIAQDPMKMDRVTVILTDDYR